MAGDILDGRLAATVQRWGLTLGNGASQMRSYRAPNFTDLPAYRSIRKYQQVGGLLGLSTPFFRSVEAADGSYVDIDGTPRLNFAWCDYLGLNRDSRLTDAAKQALDQFGPCVSASRMVSGELQLHQQLESELAEFTGVDAAILFVSGHAANVSTIGSIMTESDLIVHDEFVHNSAVIGMRLSRATCRSFRHNDLADLERVLSETRHKYKNALVIVEGLYSTEGDIVDLARAVEVKERYGCWLMVDDAHGVGVLGKTGRGIAEASGVEARKIDIWMGTLSKTLASCGGYIAGSKELVEVLRHTAPGFVYSVCLPPAMTAAALAALRVLKEEPERVERMHANCRYFLETAHALGLNTGQAAGFGMLPIISGDTIKAIKHWHGVFAAGVNPSLIVYPGVPMKAGRLRFFLSCAHSQDDIRNALEITAQEHRRL